MNLTTILNGGKTPVTFIGTNGVAVVTSDITSFIPSALFVGVAGDVAVMFAGGGTPVVFKNVPAGAFLPINVVQVYATNTTATDIVRLF